MFYSWKATSSRPHCASIERNAHRPRQWACLSGHAGFVQTLALSSFAFNSENDIDCFTSKCSSVARHCKKKCKHMPGLLLQSGAACNFWKLKWFCFCRTCALQDHSPSLAMMDLSFINICGWQGTTSLLRGAFPKWEIGEIHPTVGVHSRDFLGRQLSKLANKTIRLFAACYLFVTKPWKFAPIEPLLDRDFGGISSF